MHSTAQSKNRPLLSCLLFTIIVFFATLPHITTDIYVPSLPIITQALASTPAIIQLSVAAFMIEFSLSHLVYGPQLDANFTCFIYCTGFLLAWKFMATQSNEKMIRSKACQTNVGA